MTPEEVQQFVAVSDTLFVGGKAINKALPKQLKRARMGRDEVLDKLSAGRSAAVEAPEIERKYTDAESAERSLYVRSLRLAGNVSSRLTACLGDPAPTRTEPSSTSKSALNSSTLSEVNRTKIETKQSELAAFDLGFSQFYIASSLMALQNTLEVSITTCEAFLGHRVGSKEFAARMRKVGQAFFADLAGVVTKFPFTGTVLELVHQLQYDPQIAARQEEIRTSKGMAKVVKFSALAQQLSTDGLDYAEEIVKSSLEAIEESRTVPAFDVFEIDATFNEAS